MGRESRMHFGRGGLQVNEPYNWEGGGAYKWERGLRNGSLRYMENESEKRMHLFRVFFFPVSRRLY